MDDGLLTGVAAGAGDDVRKAALLLYTLSAADRDWMLARLPTEHRRQLLDLVDELRELGIPPSHVLLDAVKDDSVAGRSSASRQAGDSWDGWCAEIDCASPSAVWPILRTEPEQLIARVLSLHDWSWASGMAQWLDPMRRMTVRVLLERSMAAKCDDASALNVYLLAELVERIRALPPEIRLSGLPVARSKPARRRVRWQWPGFGRHRELDR